MADYDAGSPDLLARRKALAGRDRGRGRASEGGGG
jgi:hypothetical protein